MKDVYLWMYYEKFHDNRTMEDRVRNYIENDCGINNIDDMRDNFIDHKTTTIVTVVL